MFCQISAALAGGGPVEEEMEARLVVGCPSPSRGSPISLFLLLFLLFWFVASTLVMMFTFVSYIGLLLTHWPVVLRL